HLDPGSRVPIHPQIEDRIAALVAGGRRRPATGAPPVEVDIFGRWVGGAVAAEPLCDPRGERVRAWPRPAPDHGAGLPHSTDAAGAREAHDRLMSTAMQPSAHAPAGANVRAAAVARIVQAVAAVLLLADLFLHWQQATVSIATVADFRATATGWAGLGIVVGALAVVVLALALAPRSPLRHAAGSAVAAVALVLVTALSVATGDVSVGVGAGAFAEVDTTLAAAWAGLALAIVAAAAALVRLAAARGER
ncbi:MAG TPA: hypothetical protein VLB47_05885, partial [Solirubrobacteraceae bacterium]|nr:hypothetical protein [Solirubrobacteraceae bacterium]